MLASDIPIRADGASTPVRADWWNIIRTFLISTFGGGSISETTFTFANNVVGATDVTAASFNSALYRTALLEISVSRKTDTGGSEVRSWVEIYLGWRQESSTWSILDLVSHGDAHGLTFSVSTAGTIGQVQYTSSNIAGANYAGPGRFRGKTFNA